jgi:hypothetical protein
MSEIDGPVAQARGWSGRSFEKQQRKGEKTRVFVRVPLKKEKRVLEAAAVVTCLVSGLFNLGFSTAKLIQRRITMIGQWIGDDMYDLL